MIFNNLKFLTNAFNFITIILFFLGSQSVYALKIEPFIGMIEVNAGENKAGKIKITNDKKIPVLINVSLRSFALSGSSVENKWFKLNCTSFTISPGEDILLDYNVSIPENSVGEYSVRIVYGEKTESQSESPISFNTAISVPFYALVKGTEIYKYRVLNFQADTKNADNATILFENQGNAHIRPSGRCLILKADKDTVLKSVKINDGNLPIYSGYKRELNVDFGSKLEPGKYRAQLDISRFEHITFEKSQVFEFEILK